MDPTNTGTVETETSTANTAGDESQSITPETQPASSVSEKLSSFFSQYPEQEVTGDGDEAVEEPQSQPATELETQQTTDPQSQPPTTAEKPKAVRQSSKPNARDYSLFDETDVPVLKQMSDQAFRRVVDLQQKHKELQTNFDKIKDLQFYHHPDSYKISPEYSSKVKEYGTQRQINQYWQTALAKLEAGQPIQDIRLTKDGQLEAFGDALEPTPELRAEVLNILIKNQNKIGALESEIQNYSTTYKTRFQEFDDVFRKTEEAAFAKARQHKEFVELENKYLEMFPAELRSSRVYRSHASALAMVEAMKERINTLENQLKGKNGLRKAIRSQGPGEGIPGSETGVNGSDDGIEFLNSLRSRLNRH